ncbi:MAG: class D beta-lactamase [Desulfarculus sp.]|nr:class D beta-lactamase [Desulfarculus sp.]
MAPKKKTLLKNNYQFLLLGFFVALAVYTYFHDREKDDPSRFFEGFQGTLVVLDLQSGEYQRFKPAQAAKRLSPMSTFKIPNALIGLETGVVSGPDHLLTWDGQARPWASHNQNHTLHTAMENSVVWYYQELATAVGPERMAEYLKAFAYGNQDISGGISQFWLGNSLKISADEQVEFLRKLYTGALPARPENQALVRGMLLLPKTGQAQLSGKTGTNVVNGKSILGWFVGHLKRGDKAYVLACNIEAADQATGAKARQIVEKALQAKGLL